MITVPVACVVDASVAVKLVITEPLSSVAHDLFAHLGADPATLRISGRLTSGNAQRERFRAPTTHFPCALRALPVRLDALLRSL
jgi:hypothetical protein